ncbi:flagellin [[Clostridium] hylemonae]|uniref:flagellin N-terminal helical domain-containing protein n=1 Tax=[Clostridium] hylemonae TaxID=89153 RepID=UPI00018A266E|nr:flagellin [[Clostridium] hylemonae]QEK19472.1 Flagellin [[Clostridium] hylemonae DSM 15053]
MRIQHNIAALNSYRNLTNNNSAVSKNLEKLSSGYRINRAGDDAAGLAISEKMRAQITGLETAQKNAQDGISLVQTAEGALTEVHSMLNRMVELADQSANGTYDNETDRANLQKEIQSLKDEIDRISEGTNFNGINLLDGSLGGATATASATVSGYQIGGLSTDVKGIKITYDAGTTGDAQTAAVDALDENGILNITVSNDGTTLSNADLEAALKNAGYKDAKVTGTGTKVAADVAKVDTTKIDPTAATIAGTRADGFKINFAKGETGLASVQITGTAADGAHGATNTDGAVVIQLDNTKSYTSTEINKILSDAGAGAMTVEFSGSKLGSDIVAGLGLGAAQNVTDGVGKQGAGLTLQIGDTADSFNQLTVKVGNMSSTSLGIGSIDISTQEGGKNAVDLIKKAINSVSSTRGDLGAIQNRLEHTINNLSVTTENMTAAESRIRDVDMANEMMAYTKNNILVQASQAMLAQANQIPQGVLQLLQ